MRNVFIWTSATVSLLSSPSTLFLLDWIFPNSTQMPLYKLQFQNENSVSCLDECHGHRLICIYL